MGILKRSFGDPTHENAEGDVDVYQTTIDTSSTQTATISHDRDFAETPTVVSVDVVDDKGEAWKNSGGASQTTVEVVNTTTDATVTVTLAVAGKRDH